MPTQQRLEPRDWREGRRIRAWELHQQGGKQKDIAAALGVTKGAVSQWLKRGRTGGVDRLRRQPPPGATARVSPDQRTELRALLDEGAEAFGFAQGRLMHIRRMDQRTRTSAADRHG